MSRPEPRVFGTVGAYRVVITESPHNGGAYVSVESDRAPAEQLGTHEAAALAALIARAAASVASVR